MGNLQLMQPSPVSYTEKEDSDAEKPRKKRTTKPKVAKGKKETGTTTPAKRGRKKASESTPIKSSHSKVAKSTARVTRSKASTKVCVN
jgi:hypothetical protein